MTISIPLNKLMLSPRNVRKTNGEEDIESLADSIHSKGLLQNLVVSEAPGGRGIYEVDAGGRRYRALQLLVARRHIPRNFPVPVLIVPRDDATEASLAENLQKVAMNPADEVVAFAAILDRYADNGVVDRAEQVANLARRFGRTVNYVEQRLRLADLAPDILQALRDGMITIDAARAYAAVSDHELQMKVFAGQEKAGADRHRVAAIRAAYAGKVYRMGDKIVRFIGFEAYREAGGRVDVDLFMGNEDENVLLDTFLVDRLAREKADAEADRVAQQAGFRAGAYVPLSSAYFHTPRPPQGFAALRPTPDDFPAEEKAESVAILRLEEDGSALYLTGYHFPKACPEHSRGAAPASGAPFPPSLSGPPQSTTSRGESEIERLARIRRQKIEARALQLAAPRLAGTPLARRAFWPPPEARSIEPVQKAEDGDYVVAILIRIPAADVDKVRAAAERALDQEEARQDGERRAAEAPADTAEQQPAELEEAL